MTSDPSSIDRFLSLGEALSGATTPRDVGRVAAEHLAAALPCDFAGALKFEGDVFVHIASSDPEIEQRWGGYKIPVEHPSGFVNAIRDREIRSSTDTLRSSAGVRRVCELAGVRAGTVLPLLSPTRPLGLLYIAHRRPAPAPGDEELRFLGGVARQTAIALDRAIVLQDLQGAARAAQEHAHQLRERNEELDRLIFLVAHDLRTPLVSIQNFLVHVDARFNEQIPAGARFYLERIAANCQHLINLNHQILELARVGRGEPLDERVDLYDTAARVVAALEPLIHEAQASVDIERLPTVHGNRPRIQQLFQNLLSNALQYGKHPERPLQVRIYADRENGAWRVSVWNSGPPIPADAVDRIFDLFYRLPDAVGKNPAGTGAGLAIVRRIVEALGGNLGVNSDEAGVRFWFTLPEAR
ncbi:MAG: GAF domain-containing sensor histidine kinase [Gemmatimonadetes bacterium]|nr:GAF domain-containing sensor histidine kinase [Gemmatimonadota bacterium]